MRRALLAVLAVVTLSLGVMGQSGLYGMMDSSLAVDLSGGSIALLDTSLASMTLGYGIADWVLETSADFGFPVGLEYVELLADGYLGDIGMSNAIRFYPIGEQRSDSSTRTEPTHLYDFRRDYFIDDLEITNVNATDSWYVRVSSDLLDWTDVAGPFASSEHETGIVSIGLLARYVEVVPVSGVLTSSPSSPEEITITYSRAVLSSRLRYRLPDGMTFSTNLSLANSGTSYFKIDVRGPRRSEVGFKGTLKFSIEHPGCQFRFQQASATLSFALACIENFAMGVILDDEGFDEASFSLGQIDVGVPWLILNGEVVFDVDSKTANFVPELVLLSNTCAVVYGSLVFGATNAEIDGLSIYGLWIEQQIGDVTFSSLTYFDEYYSVPVLGIQNCFESLSLMFTHDGCCGGFNQFAVVVAFARDSTELFGWAETDFSATVGLGESLSTDVALVVDRDHNLQLVLGFSTAW